MIVASPNIGFSALRDNENCKKFINALTEGKLGAPEIKGAQDGTSLYIYSLGAIRFVLWKDDTRNKIINFDVWYKNDRLTSCSSIYALPKTSASDFGLIGVEVSGVSFFFDCLNSPLYALKKEEEEHEGAECNIAVTSFVNFIEIYDEKKLPKKEEGLILYKECYIPHQYPCNAFISAIIKGFSLEKNPITDENYYAIDAECLGVNFKLLANPKMIVGKDLQVGRIARGSCWNTAFIVGDIK